MMHKHKQHINKRRKDKHMRKLIDIVSSMADNGLTDHAAGVCAGNNVPFDVALRVITRPKQRRVYKQDDDHSGADCSQQSTA